jgi:AmiR/NasT family two-component response regulator
MLERLRLARERSAKLRERCELVVADAELALARFEAGEVGTRLASLTEEVAGLRRALESRAVIEQAKGIIVARTGLSPDAAFDVLARQSQHENRKLREVAAGLVAASVRQRPGAVAGGVREPRRPAG